jgi:hypothetical protein
MTSFRYSPDLKVTRHHFESSGWKEVMGDASSEGYPAMWEIFSTAARSATEGGQVERGKVLWLLADACSMMLSSASVNEPFKPFMDFEDRRSVIPEDFSNSDIQFFAEIVDLLDNVRLKARLAELVWMKGSPRNARFALIAIDAYRSFPFEIKSWVGGADECWRRALKLALMLKTGAGERVKQMEDAILEAFNQTTHQDGFLAIWLADLLKSNGLGRDNRADVASELESFARKFETEADFRSAREYFSSAADWYKSAGNQVKASEVTACDAECWVKMANARLATESSAHAVAASFYESAIQTYRTIPKSKRHALGVNTRLDELRKLLNDAGENAAAGMQPIKSPGADITELIEYARGTVRGKQAKDALFAFANIHSFAKADELREKVLARLRQSPLQSLFGRTTVSADGRVIAKQPPISLHGEPNDGDELRIRAEMIRDHTFSIGLVVQGVIWPALEVLLLEHRLQESDFVSLAGQSPIVPKGRSGLFGKALFAGYEKDFISALHILIPQIEHMVRIHIKRSGVKTTNLDKDGIENENGLSTLMSLAETKNVLGKDLTFELDAIFCDATGPNLRNELSHGLLEENAFSSVYAIYAWWLALRLIHNTWWNAAHPTNIDES